VSRQAGSPKGVEKTNIITPGKNTQKTVQNIQLPQRKKMESPPKKKLCVAADKELAVLALGEIMAALGTHTDVLIKKPEFRKLIVGYVDCFDVTPNK
jgi:diphthamide biosynthesis methyltransferase